MSTCSELFFCASTTSQKLPKVDRHGEKVNPTTEDQEIFGFMGIDSVLFSIILYQLSLRKTLRHQQVKLRTSFESGVDRQHIERCPFEVAKVLGFRVQVPTVFQRNVGSKVQLSILGLPDFLANT